MNDHRTVRLTITGRVQGVGYRMFLRDEARRLGLSGGVRHRRDGTVEALVSGPPDATERLVVHARRGPLGGSVASVGIEPAADAVAAGFDIAPTV